MDGEWIKNEVAPEGTYAFAQTRSIGSPICWFSLVLANGAASFHQTTQFQNFRHEILLDLKGALFT